MKTKFLIFIFAIFLLGGSCAISKPYHQSNRHKGKQCDCPKETKVKVKKHKH